MIIKAKIKANNKRGPLIIKESDGSLTIYVKEPALENKANLAVMALLAKHYGVAKSMIDLVRGSSSKYKEFRIGI